MRSVLMVPANQPGKMRRAREFPADAVVFDLEDSVPVGPEKDRARENVLRALADEWEVPAFVRVNSDPDELEVDIKALGGARLCVPKATLASVMALAGRADVGAVIIEDATGILDAVEIARVPGIDVLLVGMGDMSAHFGIPELRDGALFGHARAQVVIAARAAGRIVIDGGSADYRDEVAFRAGCSSAKLAGFDGIICIHPMHVRIANEELGSSEEEMNWAREVMRVVDEAKQQGLGVGLMGDEIVDEAHVRKARRILERDAAR